MNQQQEIWKSRRVVQVRQPRSASSSRKAPGHERFNSRRSTSASSLSNRGRRYEKLALSMASDEDRNGNIFQAQVEVLPDPFLRNGPGPEASYPRTNQKP